MQVRINRFLAIASFTFALLPIIGVAHGGTLTTGAADFAVLAGGELTTGSEVRIDGSAGGANVWLGQGNFVDGDVLATGRVGFDRESETTGRVSAGGAVSLNRDAAVGGTVDSGGRVWLDRDARTGAIRADGAVSISRNARVEGPVSHGGAFWADRHATITGPVAEDSADARRWHGAARPTPDLEAGGPNHWVARHRTLDLAPGTYGSLSMDRATTLRLTAGAYDFSGVWLGREARIVADTAAGAVRINVAGDLTVDRQVRFDAEADLFEVRAGRSIHVGRDSDIRASLISFGDASIDRDTVLGGQVYADRSLWLDRGVHVLGTPLAGGDTAIPEPASALIMGLGGLAMTRRRRAARDDRRISRPAPPT